MKDPQLRYGTRYIDYTPKGQGSEPSAQKTRKEIGIVADYECHLGDKGCPFSLMASSVGLVLAFPSHANPLFGCQWNGISGTVGKHFSSTTRGGSIGIKIGIFVMSTRSWLMQVQDMASVWQIVWSCASTTSPGTASCSRDVQKKPYLQCSKPYIFNISWDS